MVKLNKIYTRTGDDGTTGLGTGERRLKSDLRVDAYGTVDEANACIGIARVHTAATHPAIDAMLSRIQNDLFDLGADLAVPDDGKPLGYEPLRIVAVQTDRVEKDIDLLNKELQPLKSFVLNGGTPAAAALHLARTVARRAERLIVALAQYPDEHVNRDGLKYINRVSDFLFVAARAVNDNGNADVLWVPGKNR
ncbi:cob(I)yrinic acid a,c-diamide adenosyltransferase [Mesorhizobium sp. M7A.T.Ca.TU.009.01.3.2]|jgi:cob(I)alamin adenosyltransferase|uniref:cob(I)yrinic acid a,c-diamide adenosyltransferase n=1 Tax=unclassified Mesorhizobium TaxID=325217 RepID=UPI000FCC6B3E|nr:MULTISPECIES: cob(I)yrinic acid a,c-diamide adenosyltransferase [unclassified Mesorhizobium]RUU12370.1 cob(I)yrinic acid a,c-diamide adenosyltransferase [Mesorhizobium sp. M7A.T.Ca.TU.009.01.3.2]RUU65960.1 cob(I)yrinic acid a,c-diamide adenosyltransferase [Mesorhizobium sp. M7A.T.Ca.TU.009.01.1.1]RUU79126.1 cob(I)yrinic acid a,c-diamide adenosyltransferase [Mesorhizobium sp. M7A.T.Ca.TU.009.01.1.2]RWO40003.1 MAG: cob(I)yrinic acid a,c-diamide adenosyltransferase [Mesorhizobium sp.]RUT84502.